MSKIKICWILYCFSLMLIIFSSTLGIRIILGRVSLLIVDHLFELFPDFEEWNSLRRNLDNLPSFWVSSLITAVTSIHERTETTNFDPIIFLEGIGHHIKYDVHYGFRLFVLEMGFLSNYIDQI